MILKSIYNWHATARPNPTEENLNIQVACHIEEFLEMMETLDFVGKYFTARGSELAFYEELTGLMRCIKDGIAKVSVLDREGLLDSLADQVVTAVGVGQCAGMGIVEACDRVDKSNWSKFNADGTPIFNDHGKIIKNPLTYIKPDLTGLF